MMDALEQLDRQQPTAHIRPVCHRCGDSDPELRHCKANRGVAWQCRSCDRIIGNWIPHAALTGLDVAALPEWVRR